MSVQARAMSSLPRLRPPAAIAILIGAVIPLAIIALALATQLAFADRILPGVRVDGVDVGGLSFGEARDRLTARAALLAAEHVTVRVGDREWQTTYGDLGVTADVAAATDRAFAFGHQGPALARVGAWIDTIAGGADVAMPRLADEDRLTRFVARIAADVDRAPVDGAVAIGPDGVHITQPQDGAAFPSSRVVHEILTSGLTGPRVIDATPEIVAPQIGASAIEAAAEQARAAYAPLRITAAGTVVDLDAARVAALVRIEKDTSTGTLRFVAQADPAAVDALVAEVAAKVDRPARDAILRPSGNGFDVVPSQDGAAIDRDALRAAIGGAVFAGPDGRSLSTPVAVTAPRLTTQAAQQFAGQMTLVSTYTTYFPVNASRATNIRIGAGRFNGLVIAPGGSFSFWRDIGDVSLGSGFVMSGAIIDGRSDEALGGGLCQVSTTLFNAVARSGYEIDERGPHSYYIERYPLGLDAAVFSPGQDFRWTNDTPYPVLIRSSATATSVTFSLYSVPTGRATSFTAPTERNLVMPPKDQFADPAYPKGYVVRGRDVWVTRTVTQNGALVHRDNFYSHYIPVWGGPAATMTIR